MVGPMEGRGPFGAEFDWIMEDYLFGEETWEGSESKMLRETVRLAAGKAGLGEGDLDVIIAGELLNHLTASSKAAREISIPYLGIYGACSTMAEGSILGAMLVDGQYFEQVAVGAVSHHHTGERGPASPAALRHRAQPGAQWTVTGAGALVLTNDGKGPCITSATVGRVVYPDEEEADNAGTAMAPAALDTLLTHLQDTGKKPEDYDVIITGDLGKIGTALFREKCAAAGLDVASRHADCGVAIYDPSQNVNAGGRGCGSSAAMLCGPFLNRMAAGHLNRLLVIGTGALTSSRQLGEEIYMSIAHAVAIEA